MKTSKRFIITLMVLLIFMGAVLAQKNTIEKPDFPILKGPYLDQKPPGMTPEIFAPGIISTGYNERVACFTPDGKELVYMLYGFPVGVFLHVKEIDGIWTKPEVMSFSGKDNGEGTMSPDGKTIVFCTNMPLNGEGEPLKDYYAWIVKKKSEAWGEPEKYKSGKSEILKLIDGISDENDTKKTLLQKLNKMIELKPNIFGIGININEILELYINNRK